MRKNIFISIVMIFFIAFGNITSVIAAVANSDSLKTDHQLSVSVDYKKTTNKQIFVAVNDTSNQERELTMKIPDGLSFDEAATTNENKTNQADISVDRSTSLIKIKFKALEKNKSSELVFFVVDEMKAQKSTFSVQSEYENITYTSEKVRIGLPKESSKEQDNQSSESKSSSGNPSSFSSKILAERKSESNPDSKELNEQKSTSILRNIDFDDGVEDWTEKNRTEVGSVQLEGGKQLKYAFGKPKGNGQIGNAETGDDHGYNVYYQLKNGTQIQAFYSGVKLQNGQGFQSNVAGQPVSSSPGYGMVESANATPSMYDTFQNHRFKSPTGDSKSRYYDNMTDIKYYVGTSAGGHQAMKITGVYKGMFQVEMLMRPDEAGYVIQEELYIKNISNQSLQRGIFYGADTYFGEDSVSIKAQGNNAGLYMTYQSRGFDGKLLMNMNVPDGPSQYGASNYRRQSPNTKRGGSPNFMNYAFTPNNFSGLGAESKNYIEGHEVFGADDSSYSAKWPFMTFEPNITYHFRHDLGIGVAPDVVPTAEKIYKNLDSSDKKNHVGDNLKFTLRAHNLGYKSRWGQVVISDVIPQEFDIDVNSITLQLPDGTTQDVSSNNYNPTTRLLSVPVNQVLGDGDWATVEFKAKINSQGSNKTVLNKMKATGHDLEVNNVDRTAYAEIKIPIEKNIEPVLTKQVRNISKDEKEFKDETSTYKGDKVEYEIMVTLDANKDLSDAVFKDQVDNNLTVLNDEVQMQIEQPDGSWGPAQNIPIDKATGEIKLTEKVKGTSKIRFTFEAIVNNDNKSEIDNTFSLIGGSYNGPWHSNVAKVNVGKKTPPTLIKEVKNITKSDADYATETTAEVDDEIEYRIQIVDTASDDVKPGAILKDVFDADLGDIQQVKIDYLDKDEKITATQSTDWANNQVTLDHGIPVAGQGMAIAYVKAKVKETNKSVINNSASLVTDFGTGTSEKAKLNIKQSKGRIVVRYRDRKDENHKLAEDKVYDGKIGDTQKIQPEVIPDSQGNWTVVDSSNQPNPDWSSTTKPDWELAHDYTVTYAKDEQVITYRYEESHIGIIADKRWDFGKYDTTGTDRNYYLKAKTKDNQKQPYAVGVEDYYTSKGWTLNVKQDDQFHTNANEKIAGDQKFLDNAVLNFHNGQIALKESDDVGATAPVSKLTSEFELTPKGDAVNLMTHTNKTPDPGYYAAHGFGIWEYQFGDSKQADYSIGLRVPQTTKRYPRQYTSQLTWSLVIAE